MNILLIIGAAVGILLMVIGIVMGRRNRRAIPPEVMEKLKRQQRSWPALLLSLFGGIAAVIVFVAIKELIGGDDPFTPGKILVAAIFWGIFYAVWTMPFLRRAERFGMPAECLQAAKKSIIICGFGLIVAFFCILSLLH